MSQKLEFAVSGSGARLDIYMVECYPWMSRSRIQRLIKEGYITVNGRSARDSLSLRKATGWKPSSLFPKRSSLKRRMFP